MISRSSFESSHDQVIPKYLNVGEMCNPLFLLCANFLQLTECRIDMIKKLKVLVVSLCSSFT